MDTTYPAVKPYELTATRLENRGSHPPTKEYVDRLVAGLDAATVEASWHSAVDPLGRPLFPSKVFPNCHPQASAEAFHYLLDRLHASGRPVLSWYPMGMSRAVTEAHRDWQTQFMPCEGATPNPEWEVNYVCFNSPYGELLPQFVAEVVGDLGFDGMWFDGSTWSNHNTHPMYQPGCRCRYCQERFVRDTGLRLPERVDYDDMTCRRWMHWRYDVLMDVYRRCVESANAARPGATVAFNNYRRRNPGRFGWNTAIPLRPLGLDAMMSTELDGFPHQADIQMKINQAYECKRGVETWWPLCDHWNIWVPDAEPLPAVQAALGCVSAGGVACVGVGMPAALMTESLSAMQDAAAPRMPYVGGETVEYAAILASQQTMDYHARADPNLVWDEVHGANELFGHAHLQTSVIFDAHLTPERLKRYPVVAVGEAVCLSVAQADALRQYVEDGGVMLACGRAGECDEWGQAHARPVLDDVLGIVSRQPGAGRPTLRLNDEALRWDCGRFATLDAAYPRVEPSPDVQVLADILVVPVNLNGDPEEVPGANAGPGLWTRRVGAGAAVYCAPNLFATYLRKPTPRLMRLFRRVLTSLAEPAITLDGPLAVRVNTRVQADGSWAIHLHNAPGTAYRYPAPVNSNYLHAPGEVVPARELRIRFSGRAVARAWLALSGKPLAATRHAVRVPRVDLHEVVLAVIRQ
jgi:hypothetical protein